MPLLSPVFRLIKDPGATGLLTPGNSSAGRPHEQAVADLAARRRRILRAPGGWREDQGPERMEMTHAHWHVRSRAGRSRPPCPAPRGAAARGRRRLLIGLDVEHLRPG